MNLSLPIKIYFGIMLLAMIVDIMARLFKWGKK